MSNIEIKTVGLEELDAETRLFRASLEDHGRRIKRVLKSDYDWREETRLRIKRDFCRFLVAIADGRLVGLQVIRFSGWTKKDLVHRIRRMFVTVPTSPFRSPATGTLTDLYVESDYRRRGIARALVEGAVEVLREAGAQRIITDVLLENKESQKLFNTSNLEPTFTRFLHRLD